MESSSCNDESNKPQLMTSAKAGVLSSPAYIAILYLAAATVACFVAMQWLPASLVDGQYIPVGPDSFYHARRILDTIGGMEFYQFDKMIHAPEGSLLTWPWLYDWLVAKTTVLTMSIFGKTDPMSIMVYLPTFWVYVNALLLMGVSRLLGLSTPSTFVVLMCFAVSPLTQELHGVGRIDHHYMEHSMVLAVLLSGISWLKHGESQWRALMLGFCLGIAPAINNGLFILQIPMLLTIATLWYQNELVAKKNIPAIALSLVVTTILIVMPSLPFQKGEFSYYYLSWFHLYIACCSAVFMAYVWRFPYSNRNLLILISISTMLVVVIIPQILMGSGFLLSGIIKYEEISETQSIIKQIRDAGIINVIEDYSALLILTPPILVYMVIRQIHKQGYELLYFTIFSVLGITLLLLQQRMQYFGSFVLFVAPLLFFERFVVTRTRRHWAVLAITVVACCLPVYGKLSAHVPYARSVDYTYTRLIFPVFSQVCSNDPGAVLSDFDDGNYIRYHTDCSVIAMNSIITPQHQDKVLQVDTLFMKTGNELRKDEPWIKYIYVRRQDNVLQNKMHSNWQQSNPGLRSELLSTENDFPDGYVLIKELALSLPNNEYVPYARLFKINQI